VRVAVGIGAFHLLAADDDGGTVGAESGGAAKEGAMEVEVARRRMVELDAHGAPVGPQHEPQDANLQAERGLHELAAAETGGNGDELDERDFVLGFDGADAQRIAFQMQKAVRDADRFPTVGQWPQSRLSGP
jgi:hypothetical protein